MRRRYWIPSAVLVTVGGIAARGYYSHADAFLSKASAGNDIESSALTDKQDKVHFDFKSAGIISDYKRCDWTRIQLNKAEPGIGDKHFKCEELRSYEEPVDRLKAATRQGLVQDCEQAIKAALWDPGSYVFVDHLYVANEINGVDVRLTYLENDGFGGRDQWQTTCSYQL
jgi:hypothetical protein